ncbi:MAG TPA: hypothetical protein VEG30_04805 [Terriglobales bacterium]|nr:hypothetical protein [Terriglobales bacterium]
MVRSLVAFGWLRDLVIVVLVLAGNFIRHTSPWVGTTVIAGAVVVFVERFLWNWYLFDLEKQQSGNQ